MLGKDKKAEFRKSGHIATKLVELAANGMCVPDIIMMAYACLLSSEGDLWEHPPDYNFQGHRVGDMAASEPESVAKVVKSIANTDEGDIDIEGFEKQVLDEPESDHMEEDK